MGNETPSEAPPGVTDKGEKIGICAGCKKDVFKNDEGYKHLQPYGLWCGGCLSTDLQSIYGDTAAPKGE